MGNIERPLNTEKQIRQFLDAIDFCNYFADDNNKNYAFSGMNDIDAMMGIAITLIKEVNDGLEQVTTYNTYKSPKNRSIIYKSNKKRKELRETIIEELSSMVRPDNDDDICLGSGGMLPKTEKVNYDREAYILIGLPAAGKSGVASKFSDYYNAVLLDSDFAKRKIPEYWCKNGASLVHEESKHINAAIKKEATELGANIVLPIIGSDYEGVQETIRNLWSWKYNVSLVLVELDRIKATQRAFSRFMRTRRYIPLSLILDNYSNNPSLVFYKIMANPSFNNVPMALLDSDVPYGQNPQIIIERNFPAIHNII